MEDLPAKLEDITAAWLSKALDLKYPGTAVTACHLADVFVGTATKVRLLLNYNEAGHAHELPPTMWLKGSFVRHEHTYEAAITAESGFYGEWATELPVNLPRSFYEGASPDGRLGVVLMEDLLARNVRFGDARRPLSLQQQAQVVDALAELHACLWRSPRLLSLRDFATTRAATDGVVTQMLRPEYFARCLAGPRGEAIVGPYRSREHVEAGLRALWRTAEGAAQCFIHGDAHLGNLFFERDGSPGFLDWQSWQRGPPMHDLAYSIIGNLTVEDRREGERVLLRRYLDRLHCCDVDHPPSMDEAWLDYRRHALHGFMWFLCPAEMQPEAVSLAEAQRFGAAVTDLDTFGALGIR